VIKPPFGAISQPEGDPFEQVYGAFVCAYEQQGRLAAVAAEKDWLAP